MAVIDACVRTIPGVLGNKESLVSESFSFFENRSKAKNNRRAQNVTNIDSIDINNINTRAKLSKDGLVENLENTELETEQIKEYNINSASNNSSKSNNNNGDRGNRGKNELIGLLEYPHYTRPRVWRGLSVPEILTSGNHSKIEEWRYQQALDITKEVRPDLLKPKMSPRGA